MIKSKGQLTRFTRLWDVARVYFLIPNAPSSSCVVSWVCCFLLHLEQNDLFIDLIRQLAHVKSFSLLFDDIFQKTAKKI